MYVKRGETSEFQLDNQTKQRKWTKLPDISKSTIDSEK